MSNLSWNEIQQRAEPEECTQSAPDPQQHHIDNGATSTDRYDPLYMPAPLVEAHQNLYRAMDRCYRKEKFRDRAGARGVLVWAV